MLGRVKVFWFPMAIVMPVAALRVRSRNRVQSMIWIDTIYSFFTS